MQRVRRSKTPPEDQVCRLCREVGLGYRRNVRSLPGSPDIANKSRRWAIFVNGCFWHHHKGCRKATVPKSNHQFWLDKLAENRCRDAGKVRQLRAAGYRVLLVWECQLADEARLRQRLSGLREASFIDSA
jgi:DNA mismatch endonuclease (patch repair protein)